MDVSEIDLEIALQKMHRLQLEEGDLGAAYWLQISRLLQQTDQYRLRALRAEEKLRKINKILDSH